MWTPRGGQMDARMDEKTGGHSLNIFCYQDWPLSGVSQKVQHIFNLKKMQFLQTIATMLCYAVAPLVDALSKSALTSACLDFM